MSGREVPASRWVLTLIWAFRTRVLHIARSAWPYREAVSGRSRATSAQCTSVHLMRGPLSSQSYPSFSPPPSPRTPAARCGQKPGACDRSCALRRAGVTRVRAAPSFFRAVQGRALRPAGQCASAAAPGAVFRLFHRGAGGAPGSGLPGGGRCRQAPGTGGGPRGGRGRTRRPGAGLRGRGWGGRGGG